MASPWVVGGEYSTGYGLFLGTWMGRLGVWAAWNESFHTRGEVEGFLERVVGICGEGLGVEG